MLFGHVRYGTYCTSCDGRVPGGAVSTIQFVATLQAVSGQLRQEGYTASVPQGLPSHPIHHLVYFWYIGTGTQR